MIQKFTDRLFFITASLVIIFLVFTQHPYLKAKSSKSYRQALFSELKVDLDSNNFDPAKYWEFRERYSPGSFLRDEENTDFFATFRIVNAPEGLAPLFYYQSENLKSMDGLISYDTGTALTDVQQQFPGEVEASGDDFVLIKVTETEYVFAFVESIEEMKRVNGMSDYISKERELLKDRRWYNATYIITD